MTDTINNPAAGYFSYQAGSITGGSCAAPPCNDDSGAPTLTWTIDSLASGAMETLTGLKTAGYTVGLVSNRHRPLHKAINELGLDGIFAFALAAGEVDVWKPDPGIFFVVMERTGLRPETCVYVGDNYYADVISARAAGLTPVLLDPEGIFPQADCKVIGRLPELLTWLTG